jgi:hypothetical protein
MSPEDLLGAARRLKAEQEAADGMQKRLAAEGAARLAVVRAARDEAIREFLAIVEAHGRPGLTSVVLPHEECERTRRGALRDTEVSGWIVRPPDPSNGEDTTDGLFLSTGGVLYGMNYYWKPGARLASRMGEGRPGDVEALRRSLAATLVSVSIA